MSKTIDKKDISKFKVETSSDLHKYTKKDFIHSTKGGEFIHKLHHTPTQTVWAKRPHKFQDGYKVFIGTTSYYKVFVDGPDCGMTQSIAFIRCESETQAKKIEKVLQHPLYTFINNICRWGNFNNIRILQSFPVCDNFDNVYQCFSISENEQRFIKDNV